MSEVSSVIFVQRSDTVASSLKATVWVAVGTLNRSLMIPDSKYDEWAIIPIPEDKNNEQRLPI
jgi:hypothetical protein